MDNSDRALWERQQGESEKAFEAFVTYRDLGPARSLTKVSQELNKSRTLLGRWSSRWRWVHRTAAWEVEQDRFRRNAQLQEIAEMSRRHARQAQRGLGAVSDLQDTFLRRLQDSGQEAFADLSDGDLMGLAMRGMRLIEPLSKVERKARGLPDSWVMIAAMSDEQLTAFVYSLLAEQEREGSDRWDPGDERAALPPGLPEPEEE